MQVSSLGIFNIAGAVFYKNFGSMLTVHIWSAPFVWKPTKVFYEFARGFKCFAYNNIEHEENSETILIKPDVQKSADSAC